MMSVEDVGRMIRSYLLFDDPVSVYKAWVALYIAGDRIKSDKLFKAKFDVIKQFANTLNKEYSFESKPLFRGVLLPPDTDMSKHDLWKFDHVSFTEDIEVAKAFSDVTSQYGWIFPKTYKGHILNYIPEKDDMIWFHYMWAKHLKDDVFKEFVRFWNQKEIVIGKN